MGFISKHTKNFPKQLPPKTTTQEHLIKAMTSMD